MEAVEQVAASPRGLGRELGVEIRARRFTGGGAGNEMTRQPTRGGIERKRGFSFNASDRLKEGFQLVEVMEGPSCFTVGESRGIGRGFAALAADLDPRVQLACCPFGNHSDSGSAVPALMFWGPAAGRRCHVAESASLQSGQARIDSP